MSIADLPHLPHLDLLADAWVDAVPHEALDELRRADPVHWHPEPDGPGFWAVTRHADVVAVSRDAETYSTEVGSSFIPTQSEEALAQMRLSILNMDGAKHNRYRRLVSKGFTPRVIARLEHLGLTWFKHPAKKNLTVGGHRNPDLLGGRQIEHHIAG